MVKLEFKNTAVVIQTILLTIFCLYLSVFCQIEEKSTPQPTETEPDTSSSVIEAQNPETSEIGEIPEKTAEREAADSISIQNEEEQDHLKTSSEILKRILDSNHYDKNVRPKAVNGTGPVDVRISIYIRAIENIDDIKMEYTMQLTFRQSWNDPRLQYSQIHPDVKMLHLTNGDDVWIPDVFFYNEKQGKQHKLMKLNFFGRIKPQGEILVSYRITLLLACPMALHYYPMDTQTCPFKMASYGYSDQDMTINWRESEDAIHLATPFVMPSFHLNSYKLENCSSITSTGVYDCVQLFLEFEREFGYYLIQIYAPCIMLVLVSWVAFWLEPTATEARVSLAVTAILTVVTQTGEISDQVPPASYIKAIDVWAFMVQFMVFSTILQFTYVNYVVNYEWKRIAKSLDEANDYLRENKMEVLRARAEKKAKRFDYLCQICFPVTFAVFNIAYWGFYLRPSPYEGIRVE